MEYVFSSLLLQIKSRKTETHVELRWDSLVWVFRKRFAYWLFLWSLKSSSGTQTFQFRINILGSNNNIKILFFNKRIFAYKSTSTRPASLQYRNFCQPCTKTHRETDLLLCLFFSPGWAQSGSWLVCYSVCASNVKASTGRECSRKREIGILYETRGTFLSEFMAFAMILHQ